MQVFSYYNNKGGVSKTTSAMFMGELLATAGYPTLLLDNDSQGTLSTDTYEIPKDAVGMAEILENPDRLEEALHETRIKDLWIIPPGKDLERVTQGWESNKLLREKVRRILDLIRANLSASFEACIIDNPPRYFGISMYSSEYADKIVIPVQSESAAFKATLRTYVEMKVTFPFWDRQDVNILVTQHKERRNAATGFLIGFKQWAKIESQSYQDQNPGKKLKLRVLDTVIPDSADVENTKMEKSNLFLKRSKSELAKAYIGATEEMVPELTGLGNRILAMVEERKKENFAKNILPNAFRKTEATVGQE